MHHKLMAITHYDMVMGKLFSIFRFYLWFQKQYKNTENYLLDGWRIILFVDIW